YCAGEETQKITVKDGEYSKETQESGYVDRIWFKAFSIKYGDLNGDKKDEAVVLSVCNTGGTGNFTEGFIYSMRAGKPALIGRIPGGDRAFGGLREASVANGILIVEQNDAGEGGGACCPQFVVTQNYKFVAGKLQTFGKPDKRPAIETEKVMFEKGQSGKTLKITVTAGESKRYTVGARAGQILSVSTDSNRITLHLFEEAEITQGTKMFSAKLPKSGNYTIEVENTSTDDVEASVNISIH
ncbi:MAG: hypothetical protein ACREO5_04775, partial [Candidatus Binatia bacterium]